MDIFRWLVSARHVVTSLDRQSHLLRDMQRRTLVRSNRAPVLGPFETILPEIRDGMATTPVSRLAGILYNIVLRTQTGRLFRCVGRWKL